jgi:hypothetical protein
MAGRSEVATTRTERPGAPGVGTASAEAVLDELTDFAAALADEADDVDVDRGRTTSRATGGGGVAGDHAEEGGLADAGAGEDAEALALAAGEEGIEGADAEREGLANALAAEGMLGGIAPTGAIDGNVGASDENASIVEGFAEGVEHAAEKVGTGLDGEGPAGGDDFAAVGDVADSGEGHEEDAVVAKGDDLGGNGRVVAGGMDETDLANGGGGAYGLDDHANDLGNAAVEAERVGAVNRSSVGSQVHLGPLGVDRAWPR